MLYQRRIADNQIISAKLELHLRGSRYAGVGAQLLGIVGLGLAGFYSLDVQVMLGWAAALLLLNLWWSRRVNRILVAGRHFTHRPAVLNELFTHALLSGAVWSGTLIWLDAYLSEEHTSELQSRLLISYAVSCLQKKKIIRKTYITYINSRINNLYCSHHSIYTS